jgi:hypothetical protein
MLLRSIFALLAMGQPAVLETWMRSTPASPTRPDPAIFPVPRPRARLWNQRMRFPIAILLAVVVSAHAAEPPSTPSWPLWDGSESIEQYAKRAGLEATRTLD